MTSKPIFAVSTEHPKFPAQDGAGGTAASHPAMSPLKRWAIFFTAWLIVLMPVLFWWNTWFGRQLSDQQIGEYLHDEKHPRHIQHALVQLGERMGRHDPGVARWYADLVRLASHSADEVRNTDAWVMGQDTLGAGFHETLLKMLEDSSTMVRGNAALSLVRFGDPSGRAQIVALLQPATIVAPAAGRVTDIDKIGTAVRQGGMVAKLQLAAQTADVRSPLTGRVSSLSVVPGANVAAGTELAAVDPGADQVWEALRALYLIGRVDDLPAIRPYQRQSTDIPDRVRQQAVLTEMAIRERADRR